MVDSLSKAGYSSTGCFERIGVPADPRTAARTRDDFSQWLQDAFDLDSQRAHDLLLAIYEALANTAEFAYLSMGLTGTVDFRAAHDPAESALSVVVADRGLWRTTPSFPLDRNRGRGIALMKALSDRASIQTSTDGTTVRLVWDDVHRR